MPPATPAPSTHPAGWGPLLGYVRDLHRRSLRPAAHPLPYAWEEIGPGYCYGPAFGHWDIVHQIIDLVCIAPELAARQLDNYLACQQPDGLIAGSLWQRDAQALRYSTTVGHPPVWPMAVEACQAARPDRDQLCRAASAALAQLRWFTGNRAVANGGFYYSDVTARTWESGIDEGVRFDDAPTAPEACIDATCHVAYLARSCARWAERLEIDDEGAGTMADELELFVRERMWCGRTGFFFDVWAVADPTRRHVLHEGFWPLALGIAAPRQAAELIDRWLLAPEHFLTNHPLPSVALSDPAFSLRMWRGPTWNSITWWVANGCRLYGRADAARTLLGRSLDASAAVFSRTGAIWEFYHPLGGDPLHCQRKPQTPYNTPCRDYLGHNPLHAMARMYGELA